jgi:hypothetical protein
MNLSLIFIYQQTEDKNMNMNFVAYFCNCGRIHFLPASDTDFLAEDPGNNEVIFICENCGCVRRVTADVSKDGKVSICFVMMNKYAEPVKCRVRSANGIQLYMMGEDGRKVDALFGNYFFYSRMAYCETEFGDLGQDIAQGKPWAMVNGARLLDDLRKENEFTVEACVKAIKAVNSGVSNIRWPAES